MKNKPTIYAVSTGAGRAGIAIVRLSGSEASLVVRTLAGSLPRPRYAAVRNLQFEGDVIDETLVLWFPGPHSVTGEDVAEFHVHGSPAVLEKLFAIFSNFKDLRPAEPGEFTRRAFDNGLLDLVKVEGLADLLAAENEAQRKSALRQFAGENSKRFELWRTRLVEILGLSEALIDFADEDQAVSGVGDLVRHKVLELRDEMGEALDNSVGAIAVRLGLRIVLAGAPNVGKSSLFNSLVRRDAAIVSSRAGTTRDVVSGVANFGGVSIAISDTAGLREDVVDEIEVAGIEKSFAEIVQSDILIWVRSIDVVETVGPSRTPDLYIWNKADLGLPDNLIHLRNEAALHVSNSNAESLGEFRRCISDLVSKRLAVLDNALLVRERHRNCVARSIRYLNDYLDQIDKPMELRTEDLRLACDAAASITGRIGVEDLLGKIFSEFCIGK